MGCCGGKSALLSKAISQIKESTLTAANVIAAAAQSGKITVSKEIVEKRLDICKKCPHLAGRRCTVCGCFMTVKAGLNGATCPQKKW